MSRETVYAALFAKLSTVPGFVTRSRRLKHWDDVPGAQQPALFMGQKNERVEPRGPGMPRVLGMTALIYVYAKSSDQTTSPSIKLNGLVDAVEAALAPDPSGKQTLGGLVSHCWVSGNILEDEGVLGDQAVAIIPVHILVP